MGIRERASSHSCKHGGAEKKIDVLFHFNLPCDNPFWPSASQTVTSLRPYTVMSACTDAPWSTLLHRSGRMRSWNRQKQDFQRVLRYVLTKPVAAISTSAHYTCSCVQTHSLTHSHTDTDLSIESGKVTFSNTASVRVTRNRLDVWKYLQTKQIWTSHISLIPFKTRQSSTCEWKLTYLNTRL